MTKKAPFYGHFYAPGNCSTGRVKRKTKNGSHPVRGVVRIHGWAPPTDRLSGLSGKGIRAMRTVTAYRGVKRDDLHPLPLTPRLGRGLSRPPATSRPWRAAPIAASIPGLPVRWLSFYARSRSLPSADWLLANRDDAGAVKLLSQLRW